MLASIDLDRSRVLITSLDSLAAARRPPANRQRNRHVPALPAAPSGRCYSRKSSSPSARCPPKALTGNDAGIRKLRGKWQDLQLYGGGPEVKLLPMQHPAFLIRTPAAKKDAWADLLALQRTLNSA